MAYTVSFTQRAERDMAKLYDQINAADSQTARRWYSGLKRDILGLEKFPFRCSRTPENKNLRHLLYGHGRNIYRVVYRIPGSEVIVLHIRHGAGKGAGRAR